MKYLMIFGIVVVFFSCKKKEVKMDDLGVVNFEVTGNEMAVSSFEKGLLLLHSFEYSDAREAFTQAQKLDPEMAMAYWGEAMTYNHSLWREQDYEDAKNVIGKLEDVGISSRLNPIEQDLITAVKILYKPKTPKKDRDKAYMRFMKTLYEKYPDNNEVAAFYSLSLLGSVAEGRNDSIYGLGADVAKKILQNNAQHPGALHYLIHSYDDPYHAHLALNAANSYAVVAPDASHALHMPSHIYVALGMWDRVVSSNIDSYNASLTRMKAKELDNDARGYHAYHWLQYGHLQKGDIEAAEKMVWDMQKFCKEKPSKRAKVHLLFLKATFLAETNDWDSPIANIAVDVSGVNIALKARNYFIEGMKSFYGKDKDSLNSTIDALSKEINRETLLVDNLNSGASVCASSDRSIPNNLDIKRAQIVATQLEALKNILLDNTVEAETLLKKSVELEDNITYNYGPPSIIVPTSEMYAKFLYEQDRPEEALVLYEHALERGTNRIIPLQGIKQCAVAIEDESLIEKIDLKIQQI